MFNLTEDQKTAVKNYAAAHAAFTAHYRLMMAAELMAQTIATPGVQGKIERHEQELQIHAEEALWIGTNLGLTRDEIVCPRMAQYLPQPEMED